MDDLIEKLAEALGIKAVRGSVHDVLDRFRLAAILTEPDRVIRVTGDEPLIDPEVVDYLIEKHTNSSCEYTTNQIERTYPRGLDVEVIELSALEKCWHLTADRDDHEHVTTYIRDHQELFKIQNIKAKPNHARPKWRLCLDTKEDYKAISAIYDNLYNGKAISLTEVIVFLDNHPEIIALNNMVEQSRVRGRVY
jgi:spore coat polysaccharide biosynthesis protein SpsF